MRVAREYVDYMAREIIKRLGRAEMVTTRHPDPVVEKVREVMLQELAIEDRINEKVREYMNRYAEEIRRSGVSYQEMFKKIKSELVRREKVIL